MAVLYLVFNEGYAAASGQSLARRELCQEAIRLTRCCGRCCRRRWPSWTALLALMLLHDARRAARVDAAGELVLLADQDRRDGTGRRSTRGGRWCCRLLRRGRPGTFALEAAIAAVHAEAARAEDTDWRQILGLYDQLYAQHPSPVVALNRAVALSMADGPPGRWRWWSGCSRCSPTTSRGTSRERISCAGWAAATRRWPATSRPTR